MVQHQQLCRLDREAAPSAYRIDPAKIESLFRQAIESCDAVVF